jgi:tetratricopeptide (TPR) repeat protein
MTALERGIRFYNSKRYEQALREFQEIEGEIPENVTLAYYTGLTLAKLERFEEALIPLEQVVTASTSLLHVYQSRMILAFIYAVTGRAELAVYELNQLLKAGLESVQLYGSLGHVLYALNRVDEAIAALEKALEINPEYANALNSLGFIYAERGTQLERAVDLCRRAARQQPRNPAYLDSFGWAQYRKGNLKEARETLRKALDLAPRNAEIAAHMREVLGRAPEGA